MQDAERNFLGAAREYARLSQLYGQMEEATLMEVPLTWHCLALSLSLSFSLSHSLSVFLLLSFSLLVLSFPRCIDVVVYG